MIHNPVLSREFTTSLRTPRALLLGLVFLLALTGFVMLMWPTGGIHSLAASSSRKMFSTMSLALLTLVSLCAPAFTAVCITREKEEKTFELLHHTPLGPSHIMVGKLAAGLGLLLIYILSSAPMMAACFVLGGVPLAELLLVYAIVALAAVFLGILAMAISTVANSSFRALIVSYAFIIGICGLTWVPSIVLAGWARKFHAIHFLRALSPFAALMSVLNPERFAAEHYTVLTGFGALADSVWPFVGLAGAGSVVLLLFCYLRLLRPPQPRQRGDTALIDERLALMKRHVKFPFYLLDPKKRKKMIGGLFNVIFIKEMRSKAFGRAVWVIRSMYFLVIISLLLSFLPLLQIADVGIDTIVLACVSLPLGIILLISPVLTATGITEEREKGVFDMLRCTRLSAWTMVWGKLQVAWLFLIMLVTSTIPTFFVLAYVSCSPKDMDKLSKGLNLLRPPHLKFAAGWEHLRQVNIEVFGDMLAAFGVVVAAMVLATVAALTVSAFARKSSHATAISYGVVLGWAGGTLLPSLIPAAMPPGLLRIAMTFNPFVAAANAVSARVFRDVSATLWQDNIQACLLIGGLLMIVCGLRVHHLMSPDR